MILIESYRHVAWDCIIWFCYFPSNGGFPNVVLPPVLRMLVPRKPRFPEQLSSPKIHNTHNCQNLSHFKVVNNMYFWQYVFSREWSNISFFGSLSIFLTQHYLTTRAEAKFWPLNRDIDLIDIRDKRSEGNIKILFLELLSHS